MAYSIKESGVLAITVWVTNGRIEVRTTVMAAADVGFNRWLTVAHVEGCKKKKENPD
jgi:hypothetical protein